IPRLVLLTFAGVWVGGRTASLAAQHFRCELECPDTIAKSKTFHARVMMPPRPLRNTAVPIRLSFQFCSGSVRHRLNQSHRRRSCEHMQLWNFLDCGAISEKTRTHQCLCCCLPFE